MATGNDFLASLNDDEALQIQDAIETTKAVIQDARRGKKQQSMVDAYKAEMLAARGNKPLGRRIKEQYRARGLDTDTVVFTV